MLVIGFTYDLKSEYLKQGFSKEEAGEFDHEDTINAIAEAIAKMGHIVEKIGTAKQLIQAISDGRYWDLVINICEGVYGLGREAQVPAILDVYNIPYVFSDVLTLSLTLHKGLTKRVIRDAGIPTAPFAIVACEEDIENVNLPYPLFVKPVAEGSGKGIYDFSKVNNKEELTNVCIHILENFNQEALVETYLPGREFTVGIIGNGKDAKVLGAMEVHISKPNEEPIYSFSTKENYVGVVNYTKTENDILLKIGEVALDAWKALNCKDAGRIDIRFDENNIPNFIEVNPLAGLRPIHSDLVIIAEMNGMDYDSLIQNIVNEAIKRHKLA